ncbi:MAG: hypothetical protein AAB538_00200 [Patescibacteria group bacterium]
MNKFARYALAAVAGFTGLVLLTATSDREFINLAPTEGESNAILLESGHAYTQAFRATRNSPISRVGIFLRPAAARLSKGTIVLSVESEGTKATQEISTDFIDREGPTQVRFAEPIPTSGGAEVTITLRVPENLSGQIRAQLRPLDETFDPALVSFAIDREPQAAPLGYQVYYIQHPPLALQLGGLLLLTALFVVVGQPVSRPVAAGLLAIALPIIYVLPGFSPLLVVIQMVVLAAVMHWLKRFSLHPSAVLLGAVIFTFTTWWPLHIANNWQWIPEVFGQGASLKDIFLDPRQIPSANGGNWEHYGSYIGIIAAVLAFLGLAATVREKKYVPYIAITLLSPLAAVMLPDLVIVTTFGLAFLAAHGLEALRTFLGRDRLAAVLCSVIVVLVLLDLLHVGARTLEFGIL